MSPLAQKPPWTQEACRPSAQNWQVPSEVGEGYDDQVDVADGGGLGTDVLDDADELVPDPGPVS